ncbi:hypothetical protein ACT3TZ_10425 [Brachybacterium sp. AOP25-B2-12]|uniref:hypothetical protein n=1 Tax=Brachybacterium sp. AOP25-B2-12 TaxID=3457710 RepID=UPI0040340D0A
MSLIEPATEIERISELWETGQRIVLRLRATLEDDFWEQTSILRDEPVLLVGLVTCLPARANWRRDSTFRLHDGIWEAETLVEVDGSVAAVELIADAWIVGPGRTGSQDPSTAIHAGAKLWQLSSPIKLALASDTAAFPTTAISFAETGRRDVPWSVEISPEAEPHWSVSSSMRLYVNTDSELGPRLVDGTAAEDMYTLIQSDIHLAVLYQLAIWRDAVPLPRMQAQAESDPVSLAAFGATLAQGLGLPLNEALRAAREEPLSLVTRSREALSFGREMKNP